MSKTPIAADVNQALYIHLNLTSKVPLHCEILSDVIPNRANLAFGKIAHGSVRIDSTCFKSCFRRRTTDPVDVGEPNKNALIAREIYAFNSSHSSSLTLLVARVLTYHIDLAAPADNLALGTALGYRCRDLHGITFSLAGRLTK